MKPLELGVRVRHRTNKKSGMVVGPAQHGINHPLVPVALEGSTRQELWPDHLIIKRKTKDQLPAHGGSFQAPKGYPFNTH